MTEIILGNAGPKEIKVSLSALIQTRLLIQANSGGGKSYTVKRLLEQSYGKVQQIIIDPEGEYRSLQEKFDYILIGNNGDVDLEFDSKSVAALPAQLLELRASVVIDLSDLSLGQKTLFVAEFLNAMLKVGKHLWRPCLVIIDEAHLFCPQVGDAASKQAVIDLCTRGRKRRFCAVLATQRISKLSKDAAAELLNKLIGRTMLDIDRKRAGDELLISSRKKLAKLRELEPGEFYAFGPAISSVPIKFKVGLIDTSHPQLGIIQSIQAEALQAMIDLRAKSRDERKALLYGVPIEVSYEVKTSREVKGWGKGWHKHSHDHSVAARKGKR